MQGKLFLCNTEADHARQRQFRAGIVRFQLLNNQLYRFFQDQVRKPDYLEHKETLAPDEGRFAVARSSRYITAQSAAVNRRPQQTDSEWIRRPIFRSCARLQRGRQYRPDVRSAKGEPGAARLL